MTTTSRSSGTYGSGFSTTISDTTTSDVPAGHKVQLDVGWFGGDAIASVSGGGLVWGVHVTNTGTNLRRAKVSADAPAGLPSGTVITVTLTITHEARSLRVYSTDGLELNSHGGLDSTGSSAAASGANWSQAITTVAANTLVFADAWVDFYTGGMTPTAPSTEIHDWTNSDGSEMQAVVKSVSASGAQTIGGTYTGSHSRASAAVAFKPAPALTPYQVDVLADAPLWADLLRQTQGTSMDGDYSGNGRVGTIDAGVVLSTAPAAAAGFSKAWLLDAYEGGQITGASWMAPAAEFTAEIWCYLTAYPANIAGDRQFMLFCRSDVNGANLISNKAWSAQVLPTGAITGRLWSTTSNTQTFASAAGAIPLNTPCLVTLTHDGTDVKCRVNKAQVATVALSGAPVTFAQNSKPLTIGKDSTNGAAGGWNFKGSLWGAALYGVALAAARSDSHYDKGMNILTSEFEGWGVPL